MTIKYCLYPQKIKKKKIKKKKIKSQINSTWETLDQGSGFECSEQARILTQILFENHLLVTFLWLYLYTHRLTGSHTSLFTPYFYLLSNPQQLNLC